MILDIVLVLLCAYTMYEVTRLKADYKVVKNLNSGLYSHIDQLEKVNSAMWQMIKDERKGNKGKAKSAESGNVKITNRTGKDSARKGVQR